MAEWPFVSIVVPVFNGSHTIDATLQSLLKLNYPREQYEIIVVDNNSQDDTPQRVQNYPAKLLYEREVQSSYAARNRGIQVARGEWIALTDADCVAHPDWLDCLLADSKNSKWGGLAGGIKAYQSSTTVQQYLTNIGWFTSDFNQSSSLAPQSKGEQLCSRFPFLNYRTDVRMPTNLLNPPTANVAYRRETFDKIGYFDVRLTSGGDMDFAWRLQTQTDWQIASIPEAIIYHQHRPDLPSMARLYRKNGWGYGLQVLKYGAYPHRMARQLAIESVILIGLSAAAHTSRFCARVLRGLVQKPSDSLYLKSPLFTMVGSVNYYYGRLAAARKGNEWLSKNSYAQSSYAEPHKKEQQKRFSSRNKDNHKLN